MFSAFQNPTWSAASGKIVHFCISNQFGNILLLILCLQIYYWPCLGFHSPKDAMPISVISPPGNFFQSQGNVREFDNLSEKIDILKFHREKMGFLKICKEWLKNNSWKTKKLPFFIFISGHHRFLYYNPCIHDEDGWMNCSYFKVTRVIPAKPLHNGDTVSVHFNHFYYMGICDKLSRHL